MFIFEEMIFVLKVIVIGSIIGAILIYAINAIWVIGKRAKPTKTYNTDKNIDEFKPFVLPEPEQKIKLNISYESSCTDSSEDNTPVGELSHINLGKPEDHLGCFLNYNMYHVTGIDEDGKRRLRVRSGMSEQQAIKRAESSGLHAPFNVKIVEHDPITEKQFSYLTNLGVTIPDFVTKDDASCMISRVVDDDLVAPSAELIELANSLGTEFSAFIGSCGLHNAIIHQASNRDRAALYAYGIHQYLKKSSFGNMLKDPNISRYYDFADYIYNDPSLLKSLCGRDPSDFKSPHKGTKIYKAAATFFNLD